MSTPAPFSSQESSAAFGSEYSKPQLTLTPMPLGNLVTPAPMFEDAKSMSGLEVGVMATAIALGIVVLCVIFVVGKRM